MARQTTRTRGWKEAATLSLLLFSTKAITASDSDHHRYPNAAAFVFRRIPPLEQELGSSPTLSRVLGQDDYYFDPLQLASDDNFARFRECELKHGRVAMLATIGMVAPSIVRGDSKLTACNVIQSLTLAQYLQILASCAFLEAFVFVQQDPKDMPGDYATGFFGLRDKGANERCVCICSLVVCCSCCGFVVL